MIDHELYNNQLDAYPLTNALNLIGGKWRLQYMEIPPHVEYALSDERRALIPALKALADWGSAMSRRHG